MAQQLRRNALPPEIVEELMANRRSKWIAPVVLHLRNDTMRFSELQRDIGSISQKALSATLRRLERNGFVNRTSYATIPPRVDYTLTDLGKEVLSIYEAFEKFAARHWEQVLEARNDFDAREQEDQFPPLRAGGAR